MKNSFICIDLGASNTRYMEDDGNIHFLPNNIKQLSKDTVTNLDMWSNNDKEAAILDSLDMTIEKTSGNSDYFPIRFLLGNIANRFTNSNERPTALQNKHRQRVNYVSAISAVAIARLLGRTMGMEADSDDVHMYLALPPVEAKIAFDYMTEQLCGKYKVKFNMLDEEVEFNVVSLKCMEESYAALTTFFFDSGKIRPESAKYAVGNVLSLDIGASTTDIVAVKDMKFLERTGKTFKIGGNVVRDEVISLIQQRDGYEINQSDAETVVAEGRVQRGIAYSDASDIVERAKSLFAAKIVENMQTYFTQIDIPIQSFLAIVVSGGGSMRGEYTTDEGKVIETSKPMSAYITEKLHSICDTVAVEYIGDNPRLANIKGLYTRALYDKIRREASKQ